MSNFPNNPGYNPQSANGQYAVMTPPPRQEKKRLPLAYTAGGGLFAGLVAGLIMISAGQETPAVAASAALAVVEVPAPSLGDLAAKETAPKAAGTPEAITDAVALPVIENAIPNDAAAIGKEQPDLVAAPAAIEATLRFEVTPAELQTDIEIAIDGESITSDAFLLMLDPKNKSQKVQLTASAAGYRDFKKSLSVSGDMRVAIEMRKVAVKTPRPAGDKPTRNKSGGTKNGGKSSKNSGPGGLLDL